MGPPLRGEISRNVPLVFWAGFSSCGFAGIAALHQGRKPCPDRAGAPPGPAGRQRPVIRATHAGAAGLKSHGRCPDLGSQSRDSRPSGTPGSGQAGGILVTGQQPVLSVSLLITRLSAARGEGRGEGCQLGDSANGSGNGRAGRGTTGTGTGGTGTGQPAGPGRLRNTHYK